MEAITADSLWKEVGTFSCKERAESFWKAIEIWLQKPHVVNRRLSGASILLRTVVPYNDALVFLREEQALLLRESLTRECLATDSRLCRGVEDQNEPEINDITGMNNDDTRNVDVCIRKLLPKQLERNQAVNECVILDKTLKVAMFISFQNLNSDTESTISCIMYAYKICYKEGDNGTSGSNARLELHVCEQNSAVKGSNGVTNPTSCWLLQQLLPKLVRWMAVSDPTKPVNNASVIDIEKYTTLYQKLKQKYGPDLIKTWPEGTDPQKFVFEDIAIATYLLLLWEQEREDKHLCSRQSFVDLGCGNGLLVHLLNSEGHPGKGIDVRKRKIWDLYGSNTHLEETTITPSDSSLFPDYDWIIGNHSDELTPWIPVIAARSSYKTRYFVLPCCFHDFNGKFKRSNSSLPQYRTYLNYILEIGKVCGFELVEDTMRIPSTKRVCQIGFERTYSIDKQGHFEESIQEFVNDRCQQEISPAHQCTKTPESHVTQDLSHADHVTQCKSHAGHVTQCKSHGDHVTGDQSSDTVSKICDKLEALDTKGNEENTQDSRDGCSASVNWVENFQPRSQTELVRNCSAIDYTLRDHITNTIANALIELGRDEDRIKLGRDEDRIELGRDEDKIELTQADGTKLSWNKGGKLPLPKVAAMFDQNILRQLKNECGGLQTLLRNSHQVFQVIGGVVQLRDWSRREPIRKHKTKAAAKELRAPIRSHHANANDPIRLHKTKLCWFYSHHPDSCPRTADSCPFAHGTVELRERPRFDK